MPFGLQGKERPFGGIEESFCDVSLRTLIDNLVQKLLRTMDEFNSVDIVRSHSSSLKGRDKAASFELTS